MNATLLTTSAEHVLELIGIVAFALSGAMVAIRKDFDVVGIIFLAELTALGGGVIRDVLIGTTPPTSFQHLDLLLTPVAAAAVAMFAHTAVDRINWPILLFDAMGLGLFTVNGTLVASGKGLPMVPAAILGVATGVGGGLIRDIVARDVPLLVRRDSEIYAIPATVGAFVVAFAYGQGAYNIIVGVAAALLVFALRAAAIALGWHAPGAWRRRRAD
jgi:uncharacterized membrane protein YeiH